MRKIARWLLLTFVLSCVVFSAVLLFLHRWIATDDFRSRAQAQAGAVLGREVRFGQLTVDVWPLPAVALNRVEIATQPAIRIDRIEVRPVLPALLFAGRLELSTLLVRQLDLSHLALDDLLAARKPGAEPPKAAKKPAIAGVGRDAPAPPDAVLQVIVPQRLVLDRATWRSRGGAATMFNADARLDAQGLPDGLALTLLAGALQGTRLELVRQSPRDWDVDVEIAGGSIKGKLQLPPQSPGPAQALGLSGQLETRDLALGVLLRAQALQPGAGSADTRAAMSGRLQASTTFNTRAGDWGGLLDGLQSESRFVVHQAVVHGFDLARAVRSVGLSRGGVTRLDTLAGQVRTRGRNVELRNLVASSGNLSAGGQVLISPDRRLQGRVDVTLGEKMVGKAVGVPLQVEGTLDKPELRLTRAALAGAAIGTLILPGVGTGAGASLGEKIGEGLKGLFSK